MKNPFIESKLKSYNTTPTLTRKSYLEILKGERSYSGLEKIDFDDVTVDMADFYLGDTIKFRNGSDIVGARPNFLNELPRVSLSGFWGTHFYKCFGLKFHYTNVASADFSFNASVFPNGIRESSTFGIDLHLPNRYLMARSPGKFSWPVRQPKKEYKMYFILDQVEILKRRNKPGDPCISDDLNYDDIILNDHVRNVGCKAPYQTTISNWKICESKDEIKKAYYDVMKYSTLKKPCTSSAPITFNFEEVDRFINGSDWFHVNIVFPDQFKEIVMVKAVDIHSAIGNAGGYVGLFLGIVTLNLYEVND